MDTTTYDLELLRDPEHKELLDIYDNIENQLTILASIERTSELPILSQLATELLEFGNENVIDVTKSTISIIFSILQTIFEYIRKFFIFIAKGINQFSLRYNNREIRKMYNTITEMNKETTPEIRKKIATQLGNTKTRFMVESSLFISLDTVKSITDIIANNKEAFLMKGVSIEENNEIILDQMKPYFTFLGLEYKNGVFENKKEPCYRIEHNTFNKLHYSYDRLISGQYCNTFYSTMDAFIKNYTTIESIIVSIDNKCKNIKQEMKRTKRLDPMYTAELSETLKQYLVLIKLFNVLVSRVRTVLDTCQAGIDDLHKLTIQYLRTHAHA